LSKIPRHIAVIVPNSRLNTSIIQNLNLPQEEVAIYFPVGVSYSSDLRRVEAVTIDVARRVQQEVPGAVRGFEPFVRYHTFDSSSVNFNAALRVNDFGATYLVKHEFTKALHERYRQEGIAIPFPIRTLDIPEQAAAARRGRSGPDRYRASPKQVDISCCLPLTPALSPKGRGNSFFSERQARYERISSMSRRGARREGQ